MANTPIFPMRLPDETKQRWAAAAYEHGHSSLAEFIKVCVEDRIAERVSAPTPTLSPLLRRAAGDKKSYEADPKGGRKK